MGEKFPGLFDEYEKIQANLASSSQSGVAKRVFSTLESSTTAVVANPAGGGGEINSSQANLGDGGGGSAGGGLEATSSRRGANLARKHNSRVSTPTVVPGQNPVVVAGAKVAGASGGNHQQGDGQLGGGRGRGKGLGNVQVQRGNVSIYGDPTYENFPNQTLAAPSMVREVSGGGGSVSGGTVVAGGGDQVSLGQNMEGAQFGRLMANLGNFLNEVNFPHLASTVAPVRVPVTGGGRGHLHGGQSVAGGGQLVAQGQRETGLGGENRKNPNPGNPNLVVVVRWWSVVVCRSPVVPTVVPRWSVA